MKKLFFVVLTLLFSIGLVACGETDITGPIYDEINGVKDGIEALEDALGVDITELRGLIDELRDELDAAHGSIEDLQALIATLQAQTANNSQAITNLQGELAAAQAALLAQIQGLVADLLVANGKINDAELAITEITNLVYMYIEFQDFDVASLAAPITQYFIELPNKSPNGAGYEIVWSSASPRFIFREALVHETVEDETVSRMTHGAVVLPHRTAAQNLTLTATFKSGDFQFTKDFAVTLPISGYDAFGSVQEAFITTNGRLHSFVGIVAGIYTDPQDRSFYLVVDNDGRTNQNGDALPNLMKRVRIEENTPELEIGDEIYVMGRNTRYGTGRFFSPTMNNVWFVDQVTQDRVYVLSKGNEAKNTVQTIMANEFANLPTVTGILTQGYEYHVTGQLYKSTEERFLTGAVDGDPLYPTEIYFVEFNDRRFELYGLTDAQKTALDALNGKFVTIPVYYVDYETMFGENLVRAQYVGDGSDITVLTSQQFMDKVEDQFIRTIPTNYVSTQDQNFILPVGRKWDNVNDGIEYMDIIWTSSHPDFTSFTASRGVQVSAPFTETTITISAQIKVFDYATGTEENPVFITKTLEYTFTLKTNMIHWDDLSIVGYTVAGNDWLEGMLLSDEDPYWDTWTYPTWRSNQDDIRKIIDGDRTEIFAIEVNQRANGLNDFIIIDIAMDQTETINSVLIDSGVTGNDKIRGYEIYIWNLETETWQVVFTITNVPNNALSYHIANFTAVETNRVRIRITDSDQKNWACCYTLRLSEVQIFKATA